MLKKWPNLGPFLVAVVISIVIATTVILIFPYKGEQMLSCQGFLAWLNANPAIGNVAGWLSAIIALVALVIAYCSARRAFRQWQMRYLTEEWVKTAEFLFENTKYLVPDKTAKYEESFKGDEKVKYELVARRSIAYVDDLYNLQMSDHLKAWLRGSVDLFVKPHHRWFRDHPHLYSEKFVQFVNRELSETAG
jgi:hypothetical protein